MDELRANFESEIENKQSVITELENQLKKTSLELAKMHKQASMRHVVKK